MFRQIVLCFVPGTLDPGLEAELKTKAPSDGTPLKIQENIILAPATGGPPWMSIDVVLPIVEGATAGVLTAAVLVSVKSIVLMIRRKFPGVKIRVLSDRHPSVTYEPPEPHEVSTAIDAIPSDYSKQSRTEFAFKRWARDQGWQLKFSRLSVTTPARKVTGAVTFHTNLPTLTGTKASKGPKKKVETTSELKSRMVHLETRLRSGVRMRALALSEIDAAIADYGALSQLTHTRADRRLVAASQKRAWALRESEAKRLLDRWGRELRIHEGIDIALPEGSPVFAARTGLVVEVGMEAYGPQAIKLRSEDVDIILGHLREAVVAPGDEVAKGHLLGYSGGEGGLSTGPHLHFEVRPAGADYGDTIDPLPFLETDKDISHSERYGNDLGI